MVILGLFPLTGNGGIASWTKKFLATFPDDEHRFIPVNISPKSRNGSDSVPYRIFSGIIALFRILRNVRREFNSNKVDILHTTTSGSFGALRDVLVARLCIKNGVKSIMHCRYGCITEDLSSHSLVGFLLKRSLTLFDQIWVLDSRSYDTLNTIPFVSGKVFLTPNSVSVNNAVDTAPKTYSRVAYIGNLIPSKGLYELVDACKTAGCRLDIIGPGADDVIARACSIAGDCFKKSIFIHGKLPNEQAVKFLKQVDIVALPTYYKWEAFPISILEAMSNSKLVISCDRAAVKDMLTDLDGNACGILVEPRSPESIVKAIHWSQCHSQEADCMCRKAYEKVSAKYSTEVIYQLYRYLYSKLIF